jgi:hypothetical protein
MSEIKLDNVKNTLRDLDIIDDYPSLVAHGRGHQARRVWALQQLQDRALETAAQRLRQAPDRCYLSAEIILSLKNAQPEPEVDHEWRDMLAEVMINVGKLRPQFLRDQKHCSHADVDALIAHGKALLRATESP